MTQLGGQAELIESPKEWQISKAGVREGEAMKREVGEGQCSMIERSANVDEAAASSSELQLHSWRCFNELLPNESIEHSSGLPLHSPLHTLSCHIRQLVGCVGQWYGGWGRGAWRWIIALRWLIKWHFNEFTGKRDLPPPPLNHLPPTGMPTCELSLNAWIWWWEGGRGRQGRGKGVDWQNVLARDALFNLCNWTFVPATEQRSKLQQRRSGRGWRGGGSR